MHELMSSAAAFGFRLRESTPVRSTPPGRAPGAVRHRALPPRFSRGAG